MNTTVCDGCQTTITYFSNSVSVDLPKKYFDDAYAICHYNGIIKEAIAQLKYQSIKDVGKTLGRIAAQRIETLTIDVITSIPLHKARKKERGFNQAEVIASELAAQLNKPYIELLQRKRHTSSQVSMNSRQRRLTQLTDAFTLTDFAHRHQNSWSEKHIVIVDDVLTTGSTINECAKVLRTVNPKKITGLAIAHGL